MLICITHQPNAKTTFVAVNDIPNQYQTKNSINFILIVMIRVSISHIWRVFGAMETADGIHQFKSWLHFVLTNFLQTSR